MKTPKGYELGSAFQRDITGIYYRAVQMKLDRAAELWHEGARIRVPRGESAWK